MLDQLKQRCQVSKEDLSLYFWGKEEFLPKFAQTDFVVRAFLVGTLDCIVGISQVGERFLFESLVLLEGGGNLRWQNRKNWLEEVEEANQLVRIFIKHLKVFTTSLLKFLV